MIYYSHVNEDNQIERSLFTENKFNHLFCIAGSGERLISLLDAGISATTFIIDFNPDALHLTELKLKALKELSVKSYLNFTALLNDGKEDRLKLYNKIANNLSPGCRQFWDERPNLIHQGIAYSGHFESFITRIQPMIELVLGKGFYKCFNQPKTKSGNFPYKRWQLMKKLFSYKMTYKILGLRDEAIVGKRSNLFVIPNALQEVLDTNSVRDSFMFHLIFKGHLHEMAPSNLPPSCKSEILERIKKAMIYSNLKFVYTLNDLLTYLKILPDKSFPNSFFSLSDLLSFNDLDYFFKVLSEIKRISPDSTVVFRCFVRNRPSTLDLSFIDSDFGPISDLSKQERTRMYRVYALTV